MASLNDIDWGASGREDSFELYLVDPFELTDTKKVEFEPSGTSITWGYYTDTKASATIEVLDDLAEDSMLRIYHNCTVGGNVLREILGTFFVSQTNMTATYGRIKRSFDAYSALLRHHEDYLMTVHDYGPGDNVSGIIQEIVEADGGHLVCTANAPTDRVHTMDIHWDIGTNKLTMLNTMAGWINGQIGVTDKGEVQLDYYYAPSDKQAQYAFRAGANCIYKPSFTTSESEGDVYNRVLYYYSTDEASGSAVANLESSHTFSYERIGRHVTYAEQLDEAMEESELEYKAQTYLEEHCGGAVYYEIEHAGIVGLRPGMVVTYQNTTDYTSEINATCLITEMSVNALSPMLMTTTKMRALS